MSLLRNRLTLWRRTAALCLATVLATLLVGIVSVTPASAAPGCQNGGVVLLFARGSGASLQRLDPPPAAKDQYEAYRFFKQIKNKLNGIASRPIELGDLDSDGLRDHSGYQAAGGTNIIQTVYAWMVDPGYGPSVQGGVNELVQFLNSRYANNGCPGEAVVLGGYSQGAEVIGNAVSDGRLTATAQRHIAYIALYADPKNHGMTNLFSGCAWPGPWIKGNTWCGLTSVNGALLPRIPYLPQEFWYKAGSWCDKDDGVCTGYWPLVVAGTHNTAYRATDGWITQSASLIAAATANKIDELNPSQPRVYLPMLNYLYPVQTFLTPTQPVTVLSSSTLSILQPLRFSFKAKNTSGGEASIKQLVVAVRGPAGDALDVPCNGGYSVPLSAGQEFNCEANLPTGYGSVGTYTYWADWQGWDGAWHKGMLGASKTFALGPARTLSLASPVTVSPSNNVSMFTPLTFVYRVKNTSGAEASVKRFSVIVRGPSGDNLDLPCSGSVALPANQEFTCTATVPGGYGSQGTFTYWADWQGWDNNWHTGQLGWQYGLNVGPALTLTTLQSVAVEPTNYEPKLSPLRFTYRVKNTSGAEASIKRLVVAVRGPAGDALDVPCTNGYSVPLPANHEFYCEASLPSGYGSTGRFTFWADWQGWDNNWHSGQLGPSKVLTLY